jgi:competence protein ComEC
LLFGTFSLSGLVANLPVVFFSNLAMYAAIPMFLFHGFTGGPASIFAFSSWFFARLTLESTLFFSRLPFSSVAMKPDLFEVAAWYVSISSLFLLFRRAWGKGAILLLLGANAIVWHGVARPSPNPPEMVTVNLGNRLAVLFSTGGETLLVDTGRSPGSWERIVRQADAWNLARPTAVVGFLSPDPVVGKLPVRRRLDSTGRSLALASAVVTRPGERIVRIDGKRRSLLLVSGMGRLKETAGARVDVAMVWVYRFTGKQWKDLDAWREASRPGRLLLVPGSFMPAGQRELLRRYAASRAGVAVRSTAEQFTVP